MSYACEKIQLLINGSVNDNFFNNADTSISGIKISSKTGKIIYVLEKWDRFILIDKKGFRYKHGRFNTKREAVSNAEKYLNILESC